MYFIGTGDFDIDISISNYTPDSTTYGCTAIFRVRDDDVYDEYAQIAYRVTNSGATHSATSTLRLNANNQSKTVNPADIPTKLKIKRTSTTITTHYYLSGSWTQIDSRDFGSEASKLKVIDIYLIDNNLYGGSVDFDDLVFHDGCPDTYPKYWTTTSTTSTMSTTSSTSPVV